MDFPAYVPDGARAHIRRTLEGDGRHWKGVNTFVAEYRSKGISGSPLEVLEREQACLQRFVLDARMRDVYAELQKVFTSDDQYAGFLRSAWGADMDFAPFRDRTKKAKALTPKIAAAARELASLLEQAGNVSGGMAPDEFYSIRSLLNATDNHENCDHNLRIWRGMRGEITGTRGSPVAEHAAAENGNSAPRQSIIVIEEDAEEAGRNNPDALIIVIKAMKPGEADEIDHKEEARNVLGYAWGVAPDFPALLETVARAADDWTPQETGAIGVAVSNRQHNPRAEYLRAFASLLGRNGIDPAATIFAAMAGTADVVLNDANVTTSADDVRKTLGKLGQGNRIEFS